MVRSLYVLTGGLLKSRSFGQELLALMEPKSYHERPHLAEGKDAQDQAQADVPSRRNVFDDIDALREGEKVEDQHRDVEGVVPIRRLSDLADDGLGDALFDDADRLVTCTTHSAAPSVCHTERSLGELSACLVCVCVAAVDHHRAHLR
jgi:hypothetical protein